MTEINSPDPERPIMTPGTYLVLAHTIDHPELVPGLFDPSRPRLKVMGAYDTDKSGEDAEAEVFQKFRGEWASSPKDAQRFYNEITVVKVATEAAVFKMSTEFGELLKFPNPGAFSNVDCYF